MCNDQLQKSEITDAVSYTTTPTTSVADRHAGKLQRNFINVYLALALFIFGMCSASEENGSDTREKCQL